MTFRADVLLKLIVCEGGKLEEERGKTRRCGGEERVIKEAEQKASWGDVDKAGKAKRQAKLCGGKKHLEERRGRTKRSFWLYFTPVKPFTLVIFYEWLIYNFKN